MTFQFEQIFFQNLTKFKIFSKTDILKFLFFINEITIDIFTLILCRFINNCYVFTRNDTVKIRTNILKIPKIVEFSKFHN